jgi:hypothetical protein
MKNRKKEIKWTKDTKKMKKRDQVVISRSHVYIINKQDNNECTGCYVRLTVNHILWDCKRETKSQDPKQHLRDKRKDGMKLLMHY